MSVSSSVQQVEGDPIVGLFDRLMNTDDLTRRRHLAREALLYLSARIDRETELRIDLEDQVSDLSERVAELEASQRALIQVIEMKTEVTQNLLAGAPWRLSSNAR